MDQPPMPQHNAGSREALINIRAQHRQRELIDRAAHVLGRNRSEFMLEAACRAAEDVLLDQRLVQLSPEAWEQFNSLLDAPARDIPALRALLASKPVWEA
ncbi:MAG: DUF1778 domain-containing protein [Geminicoccaceae bacterium]